MTKKLDVVGIGNAIVDIVAKVDESFLVKNKLIKSSMSLIDNDKADYLYCQVHNPTQTSGGSAANTMAGIVSLGGTASFIGRVKDDKLGNVFVNDMKKTGVNFISRPCSDSDGNSTAKCIVAVTDDAERTMSTYLGVSPNITQDYIDKNAIADSKVLYLEGYLWDSEETKNTIIKSIEIAKSNNVKVAFTLSDPFCVDRHRKEFLLLIRNHIDILFANEFELKSLFRTEDINDGMNQISKLVEIAAITRSENGSLIASNKDIIQIEAIKNIKVVDTTGAGDLYAAGFLFGLTKKFALKRCGEIANIVACEIIRNYGARTDTKLSSLI